MNYYQYGVDIWENDIIVNDEFDSDQLDEDESYSWASGITDPQEACYANWRGWKSNDNRQQQQQQLSITKTNSRQILYDPSTHILTTNSNNTNVNYQNNIVLKLVDICARYIALNMPFELVESFSQPVPEDLQLKITFASFPDNVEDIRLYSCLANGNGDEYQKGEQLYNNKNVKNILQIGFHLSASVLPLCNPGTNKYQNLNVAVVCDRKRITSCHCTCSKPSSWCSHIVAVCLSRILEPQNVELRAPVSESLSKLQRDQLQKFAQYLISELPQQILPTAQKLLDELLKSNESSINLLSGAPDPTAGSSTHDISVWCLDEQILQENIRKTLSKFIVPSPHVVSDIDYLAHSSSAASAEYTSLLRPLRGREPEGMWNLISIVKELFRKRDKNSIPLLRIITIECVNLDQIINLWFLIKVSPLYNERSTSYNQRQQHNHHTPPVHQACASLLDEIVSLWRIACLNPIHINEEKQHFKEQLSTWQKQIYDKLRKFCNSTQDKLHLLRRLDPELFSAFIPAIDACQMSWSGYDFNSSISFKRLCTESLPLILNSNQSLLDKSQSTKSGSSSSEGFCEDKQSQQNQQTQSNIVNDDLIDTVFDTELQISTPPPPQLVGIDLLSLQTINLSLNTIEKKKLEILFSRCEALYAHGYNEQACILAKILAEYLLSSYNHEKIYDDLINCNNQNCINESNNNISSSANNNNNNNVIKTKYITNFQSCLLWKSFLLTNVLLENTNNTQLAFRIGVFALEMPRQPASTKALEVKLFNQEQDLVLLLKRIPLGDYELSILRDRAKKIIDHVFFNINFNKCKCNYLNYLPIQLSSFIFDTLTNEKYGNSCDEMIGFDAAVAALTYKPNVNETQHAIYCEGIRRQKGDLAITLLLTYKDDQTRLLKIIDKILDKEIHVLFKTPINPFQPSLKRRQQNLQKTDTVISIPINNNKQTSVTASATTTTTTTTTPTIIVKTDSNNQINKSQSTIQTSDTISKVQISSQQPQSNSQSQLNPTQASGKTIKYSAIDSLSSGWEESESEGPNHNSRLLETKFRCLNLNKQNNSNNKKGFSSFDSSAPETTSSDNSPTLSRKTNWTQQQQQQQQQQISSTIISSNEHNVHEQQKIATITTSKNEESDSGESLSSGNGKNNSKADENTSSIGTLSAGDNQTNDELLSNNTKTVNMTTKPWVDGSFNEYTEVGGDSLEKKNEIENNQNLTENNDLSDILSSMLTTNPNEFVNYISRVTSNNSIATTSNNNNDSINNSTTTTTTNNNNNNNNNSNQKLSRSNKAKNKLPIYPNQPSEALAHFMFDFSKTILSKAGGPISTSIFLNHNNSGPHRNLHMCAFLIALYALGLHNCVQTNWFSRTYSSHVSWINGQASEIGFSAICILIECWEDHLTPSECALLADRVSRGRDTNAVKAAAELALSSLKYSHSLTLQEIQRALVQCKEQNSEMLERACSIVENSVKEGNNINLADILFEVAKRWNELYIESTRNNQQCQQQQQQMTQIANELIMDPAIVSSSVSTTTLQHQASAAVAAAAAVAVTNNYIQPSNLQQMASQSNLQQQQQQQQQMNIDSMIHSQFAYMQPQSQTTPQPPPQPAPFAFAVQTLPYTQYVGAQSPGVKQNTGPMHMPPNVFIPMYTAYGTIVPAPPNTTPQNILYSPQNQNQQIHNHNPYSVPQINMFPPNNYLFQNQIPMMPTNNNPLQPPPMQQNHQQIQQKPIEIDSVSMKYLLSAYRVGMLALEALPRRVDSSHQIKYLRNPTYGDNVKWLWNISVKLGNNSLQQFCQTAANVIQNPFLIQELAFDTANYLCRNNPVHFTHALRSPLLNVLVQRCLNSYFRCCVQKMHHLTPNDHEDFINMVVTARNAFYYSNNMSSFSELLQNLKKSKACKKDLWSKLYNALASTTTNTSNYS